jgi:AcrR family transcriptional regulator
LVAECATSRPPSPARTTSRRSRTSPPPKTAPPRRLPPAERREQLERVALEVAAEQGYAGLSLDAVAERAGVTRNLLYHYFPRGKLDVFLAAAQVAGRELTDDWVTDADLPLAERLAANFARFAQHAGEPSAAWLVHRQTHSAAEPEIVDGAERYRQRVVSSVALNHFGTEDPGPLARAVLRAYLSFAETALDQAREQGLDPDAMLDVLGRTLLAAVDAARAHSDAA